MNTPKATQGYLQFLFKQLPGVQFEANPEFLEEFLPWDPWVQDSCKKNN